MKLWILLAVALLLLVFALWSEPFTANSTIRAPPYNDAETRRIFEMLPEESQDTLLAKARADNPTLKEASLVQKKKMKSIAGQYVSGAVGEFFTRVYTPKTTTLTTADVDEFMASRTSNIKDPERDAIVAYFIKQAGPQSSGYSDIMAAMGQAPPAAATGPTGPAAPAAPAPAAPGAPAAPAPAGGGASASAPAAAAGTRPANPLIKAPNPGLRPTGGYTPEEGARIIGMVPSADKQAHLAYFQANPPPGQQGPITLDLVNPAFVEVVGDFYNQVYSRTTAPITQADIDTFLSSPRIPAEVKPIVARLLKAYYIDQAGAAAPPPAPGFTGAFQGTWTTTGGSTSGSGRTFTTGPTQGLLGPAFTSFGDPSPSGNTLDSSKYTSYPQVLGGVSGKSATVVPGAGVISGTKTLELPSMDSLGASAAAQFFPFSRTPGDMEKIPDPYRVSQMFNTASYSSKTDPVPFLTDFSAFQR